MNCSTSAAWLVLFAAKSQDLIAVKHMEKISDYLQLILLTLSRLLEKIISSASDCSEVKLTFCIFQLNNYNSVVSIIFRYWHWYIMQWHDILKSHIKDFKLILCWNVEHKHHNLFVFNHLNDLKMYVLYFLWTLHLFTWVKRKLHRLSMGSSQRKVCIVICFLFPG